MANAFMDLLTPKRRLVDLTMDPGPGEPYDLSGATTRPVAGSDYGKDALKRFMLPGQGDVGGANAGLALASLQSARQGEVEDALTTSLRNPVSQMGLDPGKAAGMASDQDRSNTSLRALLGMQEQSANANPYSDANVATRAKQQQDAADAAGVQTTTYNTPAVAAMRQQQIKEGGQTAQATAYGKGQGENLAATGAAGSILANREQTGKERLAGIGQGIMPPLQGGATAAPAESPTPSVRSVPGAASSPSGAADPLASEHGQQIMSQLDPASQADVKSLLNYDTPMTGYMLARSPRWSHLANLARQIDPEFDLTKYDAGQKLRVDATSGELSQRLRSLNQAAEHLYTLDKLGKNLNNVNFGGKPVNTAVNAFDSLLLGDKRQSQFKLQQVGVESEMGRLLAGTGGTDALRQSMGGGITSNSSDDQIQGYVAQQGQLLHGAYDAMRKQAGGSKHLEQFLDGQLGPHALSVIRLAEQGQ